MRRRILEIPSVIPHSAFVCHLSGSECSTKPLVLLETAGNGACARSSQAVAGAAEEGQVLLVILTTNDPRSIVLM